MEEDKIQPYHIIIPRQLLFDDDLQPTDKLVYGAVYFFSQLSRGVCTASNRRLAEAVNISPKTVRNCLSRLEEKHYIKRYYESESRRKRKSIAPLVTLKRGKTPEGVPKQGHGVPKQGHGVSLDNEQISNSTKEVKEERTTNGQKQWFKAFWKKYPRKVKKKTARKRFMSNVESEETFESLMQALEQQRESSQWQRENGKYVPHPSTWLNQERWEDEDIEDYSSSESGVSVKSY